MLFTLAVFVTLLIVLKRTRLGLQIRAVSQNRAMARAIAWPEGMPRALPRFRSRSARAWISFATASGRMLIPKLSFESILRLGWRFAKRN